MRYLGIVAILAFLASPVMGSWMDTFTYPDGQLGNNPPWSAPSPGVDVVSNLVVIASGQAGSVTTTTFAPEAGDAVLCSLWASPGTSSGSNIWAAAYNDAAGANYGRWYGSGNTARPRINGFGLVLAPVTLHTGWNHLQILINMTAGTSDFFHDGLHLGQLAYGISGAAGGVASADLENMGRTDIPADFIRLDNMSVNVPEPATLGLLLLGLPFMRRRR